jgi:hypothetical protein
MYGVPTRLEKQRIGASDGRTLGTIKLHIPTRVLPITFTAPLIFPSSA